jgi:LmbE family N-acetylglucosaminyl deacetylase
MAFSQRALLIYPAAGLSAAMQDAVANAYVNNLHLETFANERLMFTIGATATSTDYGATTTHRQISSAATPALAAAIKTALAGMAGNWYLVDANSGALLDTNDTTKKPGATVTKQLTWAAGVAYVLNEVVSYQGQPYAVIQAHTSQATWQPDIAAALFKRYIAPGQVSEFRQPAGAHDSYPIGARVRYADKVWKSAINANVWVPGSVGAEALWIDEAAPPPPVIGEWVSGEQGLKIGDKRTYQGVTYSVRQSLGVNIWAPPTVPALWAKV